MKIGICDVNDLPGKYKQAFLNGKAHLVSSDFLAVDFDIFDRSFLALIMGPGLIIPPALILFYVNFILLTKPDEVWTFAEKVIAGTWAEILITILGILLIAGLTLYMGYQGIRILTELFRAIVQKRKEKAGNYHYGLILDKEVLVGRVEGDNSQEEAMYFPAKAISRLEWRSKRVRTGSSARTIYRTYIIYEDENQRLWEYELDVSDFKTKDHKVHKLIDTWHKQYH